MKLITCFLIASAFIAETSRVRAQAESTADDTVTRVPVVFSGGHETDPRDHGRPVVLVAAALGVTPEVFREAFSHVRPAGPGSGGPTGEEARANKAALMAALGKFGVTNDRLDEVSNFYRYRADRQQLWKNTAAKANALVRHGVVVGFEIVNPGAGYSSPPTVSVPAIAGSTARADLFFGRNLATNGSISTISLK